MVVQFYGFIIKKMCFSIYYESRVCEIYFSCHEGYVDQKFLISLKLEILDYFLQKYKSYNNTISLYELIYYLLVLSLSNVLSVLLHVHQPLFVDMNSYFLLFSHWLFVISLFILLFGSTCYGLYSLSLKQTLFSCSLSFCYLCTCRCLITCNK